jgi:hypothetical protein
MDAVEIGKGFLATADKVIRVSIEEQGMEEPGVEDDKEEGFCLGTILIRNGRNCLTQDEYLHSSQKKTEMIK